MIKSIYLFETCPDKKCQRVFTSLALTLAILMVCAYLVGLI